MNKSLRLLSRFNVNTKPVRFNHNTKENINSTDHKFVPVYKFPYIRVISAVNRLKLYQTVFTVAAIPISVALAQSHIIPSETVWYAGSLGLSGCLAFYSFGFISKKFIGFIYYDDKRHLAKISYSDFWGNRKDIEVPADDVVPLSELPSSPTDGLYYTVRFFSSKETFKFSEKYGEILDKERFKRVL